jgi:hypothetical protein
MRARTSSSVANSSNGSLSSSYWRKLRAFEMMLSLFYAEELKRFLVSTIEVSERFRKTKRFKKGAKFNYAMAADVFLKEGHLSKDERDELKTLIDFRNDIAHELHTLTFDVGRSNPQTSTASDREAKI